MVVLVLVVIVDGHDQFQNVMAVNLTLTVRKEIVEVEKRNE